MRTATQRSPFVFSSADRLCATRTPLCVVRTVLKQHHPGYNVRMTTQCIASLPSRMSGKPSAFEVPPFPSTFLNGMQLIAASRAEFRRKRPALTDGTPSLVRFAVLSFLRSR